MAWIQIHQALKDHRKLLSAALELGLEPPHMLGHLVSFWLWSIDNAPHGELNNLSPMTIARVSQYTGDADKYLKVLINVGFLDEKDDTLYIHDWKDYVGNLIDRREKNKDYARKYRERKKQDRSDISTTSSLRNDDVIDTSLDNKIIKRKTDTAEKKALQEKRFEEFWLMYPKKAAKKKAKEKWMKLPLSEDLFKKIMTALEGMVGSPQWTKENGQYVPQATTWLNQERWEDDLSVYYTGSERKRSPFEELDAILEEERQKQGIVGQEIEFEIDSATGDTLTLNEVI